MTEPEAQDTIHVRFLHSETVYKRIQRVRLPVARRVALWLKALLQRSWYCDLQEGLGR